MDFSLSEDQGLMVKAVRSYLSREVAPRYGDIEYRGHVSKDLFMGLASQGILTPSISQEYGGPGLSWLSSALIMRELGFYDPGMSLAVYVVVNNTWAKMIEVFGSRDLREEIVPRVARGEIFLGIASTEPHGGSDVANIKTTAHLDGEHYVINGEKVYISGVREAREWGGGYFLLAKTRPERSHTAISAFYLPVDAEGVEIGLFETMGRIGISTGILMMRNTRIPRRYIVGEEGRGFIYATEGFMRARTLIGAAAIGSATRVFEEVAEFVKNREAFGWPLARYEAIQFKLADIWAELEASWNLVLKAAWALDLYSQNKIPRSEVYKLSAASKLLAVEKSFRAIVELTQMLGGLGYTRESIAESALRGVFSYMAGAEGAPNIMRMIIAREIFGREYRPTPL